MQHSRLTALSKRMALVLRHKPPPEMDAAGFVPLPVLLRVLRPSGATEALVRQIVAADAKGRYEIDDSSSPPRIRAVQGHSIALEEPQMEPVTAVAAVPLAIHITSEQGWAGIQDSGELRRMNRTHIHFATERRHLRRNSWASVLLRLDLEAALLEGHTFWRAANGVLLCEGPLPARFVRPIERGEVPPGW